MGPFVLSLLLCLTWPSFVTAVGRYHIDTRSCKDPDTIERSMQNAFTIAEAGLAAVQKHPRLSETEANLDAMFNYAPLADKLRIVAANINGGDSLFDQVDGILSFKRGGRIIPDTTYAQLQPEDVMIYCDTSRYIKSEENGYIDPDRQSRAPNSVGEPELIEAHYVDECPTDFQPAQFFGRGKDTVAFAYTYGISPRYPEQITLCGWYLKDLKLRDNLDEYRDAVKTLEVLTPKLTMSWLLKHPGRMDMGAFYSGLDMTLLHEMFHLRAGGSTIDVGGPAKAYGWKNCRAMAPDFAKDSGRNGPFNNADTV